MNEKWRFTTVLAVLGVLVLLIVFFNAGAPAVVAQGDEPSCHAEITSAAADCDSWSAEGYASGASGDVVVELTIKDTDNNIVYADEVTITDVASGETWEVPDTTYNWLPHPDKVCNWEIKATLVGHGSRQECGNFGPCGAPTGPHPVISHMDCDEILVVYPQAPTGLEGTTGTLHLIRPNGTETDILLSWQRYTGPVAKWVVTITDTAYYVPHMAGVYTITEAIVGVGPNYPYGFNAQNVPYESVLECDPTSVSLAYLAASASVPGGFCSGGAAILGGLGVLGMAFGGAVIIRRRR